jgi:hypothetical protein
MGWDENMDGPVGHRSSVPSAGADSPLRYPGIALSELVGLNDIINESGYYTGQTVLMEHPGLANPHLHRIGTAPLQRSIRWRGFPASLSRDALSALVEILGWSGFV